MNKTARTSLSFCLAAALVTLGTSAIHAQGWQWAHQAGTTGYDRSRAICADAAGNTYVTGSFKGALAIGGNNYVSNGEEDLFLAKYDPAGNVLWVKTAGGNMPDIGAALTLDPSGNLILAGEFQNTLTLETVTLTANGASDILIAKFSPNGDLIWAKREGGTLWDRSAGIATDASGNLYLAGNFQQETNIGGQTFFSHPSSVHLFVSRLNSSGTVEWVKPLMMNSQFQTSLPTGIATDQNGNVFVSGNITGAGNLDGTNFSSNYVMGSNGPIYNYTQLLAKFNSAGNLAWVVKPQATGSSYSYSSGVAADANGNAYITSYFSGNATFGTNQLIAEGDYDGLLAKYATDGTPVWASRIGGTGNDRGSALALHPSGQIYVAGSFTNLVTIGGTTLTSTGNTDVFVANFDQNGNAINALAGTSTGFEMSSGIALSQNHVYITGTTDGAIAFGPHTGTAFGLEDFFVASTGLISGLENEELTEALSPVFPNPFLDNFGIRLAQNSMANVSLYNLLGQLVWTSEIKPSDSGFLSVTPAQCLPKGMYVLITRQGKTVTISRVSKN